MDDEHDTNFMADNEVHSFEDDLDVDDPHVDLENNDFHYYLMCLKEKDANNEKKKKQKMLTAGEVTSSTTVQSGGQKNSEDEIQCGQSSSVVCRKRPAGENHQELKRKTKQLSIVESFGKQRLHSSVIMGYMKDLFLSCQSASLKILDNPSFQQIVVSACPNINLFSSQELIQNFRAEYELKNEKFVSALATNNDNLLTFGVETHIHDLQKFTLGSIYFDYEENPTIQKVVVSTKELENDEDIIALILVEDTGLWLKEAALIAGSEAVPQIPVVVCLNSALRRAWKTVLQYSYDMDFFKQRIAPLLELTKCEQFVFTLTEDEKMKVKSSDTELIDFVIDHHVTLASLDTTERAEPLSRSELKTARELTECLKKLKKNLFSAFLTYVKTKALSGEAKALGECVRKEIEDCFFLSDSEFGAFISLLDYRVKNDRTLLPQVRAGAITRLERELRQSLSTNALVETPTEAGKDDGFLESFWTEFLAERAITSTNVSQAQYGMSHTQKSYMEEPIVPLNTVDMHSAWLAKRGHPLFKIAKKYFSIICLNSMKVVVPHRDISSEDIKMMTFLANYPANL
ncbi:Hypothetical predicted protein [Cloeon dipterum]|uniref:Uncharacterized protein n=1 Tax=Cloeon dipterum TaxID=197152 RepID=A0A8S1E1X5_9INSE|nr:Hypothetical predicted protein [Cloeon dipterum]